MLTFGAVWPVKGKAEDINLHFLSVLGLDEGCFSDMGCFPLVKASMPWFPPAFLTTGARCSSDPAVPSWKGETCCLCLGVLGWAWKASPNPALCLPAWSRRCCRCLGSKGMAGSLSHVGTESLPSAFPFPNFPRQGCDTCVLITWMVLGLSCAGPGVGL